MPTTSKGKRTRATGYTEQLFHHLVPCPSHAVSQPSQRDFWPSQAGWGDSGGYRTWNLPSCFERLILIVDIMCLIGRLGQAGSGMWLCLNDSAQSYLNVALVV